MIIKILGIADILSSVLFFISTLSDAFPHKIILTIAIYLMLKGIIFAILADFASILDIICGIIIAVSIFANLPVLLIFIICIFLIQKGIFSLIS